MITNIYFAYFANTYNLFNDFLHFKYKNVGIKNDPTSSFIHLNSLKAKLLKKKCSSTSILTLAKITNKTFHLSDSERQEKTHEKKSKFDL